MYMLLFSHIRRFFFDDLRRMMFRRVSMAWPVKSIQVGHRSTPTLVAWDETRVTWRKYDTLSLFTGVPLYRLTAKASDSKRPQITNAVAYRGERSSYTFDFLVKVVIFYNTSNIYAFKCMKITGGNLHCWQESWGLDACNMYDIHIPIVPSQYRILGSIS